MSAIQLVDWQESVITSDYPISIVVAPRRIGKTTVALKILEQYPSSFLMVPCPCYDGSVDISPKHLSYRVFPVMRRTCQEIWDLLRTSHPEVTVVDEVDYVPPAVIKTILDAVPAYTSRVVFLGTPVNRGHDEGNLIWLVHTYINDPRAGVWVIPKAGVPSIPKGNHDPGSKL